MKKLYIVVIVISLFFVMPRETFSQEHIYSSLDPTILREQPSDDANVVQEIAKGEQLIVLEKQNAWIKVLYGSAIGYVASTQVALSIPSSDAVYLDIADLRDQYRDNKENWTKLKFKNWWKETENQLKGSRISSQGYVLKAKEGWVDGLHIEVDADPLSGETPFHEVILLLDEEKDRGVLASLMKGAFIKFTGRVDMITAVLGRIILRVEDVELFFDEETITEVEDSNATKDIPEVGMSEVFDLAHLWEQYKDNKENMTKAGFAAWWEQTLNQLQQQEIRAQGYVDNADVGWASGFTVDLYIFPEAEREGYGKNTSLCTLTMNEERDKELVANLTVGEQIEFTGNVTDILTGLGIFDVQFENVTIFQGENTGEALWFPQQISTSQESPYSFDFAEIHQRYVTYEGVLTKYGFNEWKTQLDNLVEDQVIHSHGYVVEAKRRNDEEFTVSLAINESVNSKDIDLRIDNSQT